MRTTIRKANFFYPGFEHAGVESLLDRIITRLFCRIAELAAFVQDRLTGSAALSRASEARSVAFGSPADA